MLVAFGGRKPREPQVRSRGNGDVADTSGAGIQLRGAFTSPERARRLLRVRKPEAEAVPASGVRLLRVGAGEVARQLLDGALDGIGYSTLCFSAGAVVGIGPQDLALGVHQAHGDRGAGAALCRK